MDKIDTQGMSVPSSGKTSSKKFYPPLVAPKRNVFTDLERRELKEIINEALDEREQRKTDQRNS
tara:strand:+ start:683 stop:874 length:192 start_codon:yes stop_codon:yes gene_type:complete